MQEKGFVIWLTGLPSSGKTTLSLALKKALETYRHNIEVLDGDVIRENLSKGLGYSKADRDINIRRIGFVAHLLARNGVAVICAAISPYRTVRDEVREMTGDFIEVYVKATVETCARRDVKGLYQKAFAGEIKAFTGVSDPYEPPVKPEIICDTEKEAVEESVEKILQFIETHGYISRDTYSEEDKAILHKRLGDLGYL